MSDSPALCTRCLRNVKQPSLAVRRQAMDARKRGGIVYWDCPHCGGHNCIVGIKEFLVADEAHAEFNGPSFYNQPKDLGWGD